MTTSNVKKQAADFTWELNERGEVVVTGLVDRTATEVVVPDQIAGRRVASVASKAFAGCSALQKIDFLEGVRTIEDDAFQACVSLTTVRFPASLEYLVDYCLIGSSWLGGRRVYYSRQFDGCDSLKRIEVAPGCKRYRSIDGVLFAVSDNGARVVLLIYPKARQEKRYVVPDCVDEIAKHAFAGCAALTKVATPVGLQEVGRNAFGGCSSLTRFKTPSNALYFRSIDGVLLTKNGRTLVAYPNGKRATKYVVPDGVRTIGPSAFQHCKSLTSVALPETVQTIDFQAFYNCFSLESIEGFNVRKIGDRAFWRCGALRWVSFPEARKLGDAPFYYCAALSSVFLPSLETFFDDPKRESFGAGAFHGCEAIEEFCVSAATLERELALVRRRCATLQRIDYVGDSPCFDWRDGVLFNSNGKRLLFCPRTRFGAYVVPDGVEEIDELAFSGCSGLTSIAVPASLRVCPKSAFDACSPGLRFYCVAGSDAEDMLRKYGFTVSAY